LAKVSLYINEEVWAKFREEVFRKHGSLRKLSSEVEALLSSTLVEDKVAFEFKKLGIKTEGAISSRELKERRPLLKGPSSEKIVREMRGRRIAKVLSGQ
jgi:hypothetical protein